MPIPPQEALQLAAPAQGVHCPTARTPSGVTGGGFLTAGLAPWRGCSHRLTDAGPAAESGDNPPQPARQPMADSARSAPAKINLHLKVLALRPPDGVHDWRW